VETLMTNMTLTYNNTIRSCSISQSWHCR